MLAFSYGNVASFRSFGCLFFISMLRLAFHADVSTPRSPDCEISASCFHSQKCQPPFQTITVTPKDSNVTSNCSIVTGGKVQDKTWQDHEKHLNASNGLFLQQIDSKGGNESCRCFSIQYASPGPKHPHVSLPEVSVIAYNNVSLKCLVEIDPDNCADSMKFQWFFNNSSTPLTCGEKYDIQKRTTNSRCKKDFILTIANVTDDDEGKYKCRWICDEDDPSYASFIQLNVFPEPTTETTTGNTTSPASPDAPAPSHRKWILPVIIFSSGVVLGLSLSALYVIVKKKKKPPSYEMVYRENLLAE